MKTLNIFLATSLISSLVLAGTATEHRDNWLIYTFSGVSIIAPWPIAVGAGVSTTTIMTIEELPKVAVIQAKSDLREVLNGEDPTPLASAVIDTKKKSLGSAAQQMSEEEIVLAAYDQLSEVERVAQ